MNKNAATHLNPYVGPRSFTVDQAQWFKGRDREANELMSLLLARRLTLFYSQSGAGKTSLLNARLIPMLQEEQVGFEVLPVGRVGDAITPPKAVDESFNIFIFNLAVSLEVTNEPEHLAGLRCTDFLLDIVHDGQQFRYVGGDETKTAVETDELEDIEEDHKFTVRPRALIIDQFEEIFTVHPEREWERVAFFNQITEAMEQDPYLYVLFSMRGDYIDRLSPYVKLLPDSLRTRYYMERIRENAALQAVRLPAQEAGRPFADDVSEKLVRYLRRLRTASGAVAEGGNLDPYVETVQLQVVCLQLWQSLAAIPGNIITMDDVIQVAAGFATQEEIKPTSQEAADPLAVFIDNALASYYQQAIKTVLNHPALSLAEYELRHWFSTKLITAAGTRNLLARGKTVTEGVPEAVVALLDKEHYLVRNDMRGGRPFIELVHDSFIEPIRRANRQWEANRTKQIPWLAAALRYHETQDSTLLLTGEALEAAQSQAATIRGLPTEAEAYLKTSETTQKEAKEKAEQREKVRQLELEKQREMAELERQRADEAEAAKTRQRWLVALALIIGVIALFFAFQSRSETRRAEEQTQLAIAETTRSAEQAAIAATAQAEVIKVEATRAAETLAAAEEKADAEAAERKRLANLVDSVSLIGKVESFLDRGNINAALLLGRLATDTDLSAETDAFSSLLLQALHNTTATSSQTQTSASYEMLQFQRDLLLPSALPKDVMPTFAGPQPGTLASIHNNTVVWWEIAKADPVMHSITVTAGISRTTVAFNQSLQLLASVSGTTMTLWAKENDDWQRLDSKELESGTLHKIALNQAGNQLATALCATDGQCNIQTWQIIDEKLQEPESIGRQNRVVALLFMGEALIWGTPSEVGVYLLSGESVPQPPPQEVGYSLQAIAFIEPENWLVVGGSCDITDQCGFVRYWSLDDGIWLTPPLRQSAPVHQLVYDEPSASLIAALSGSSGLFLLAWETRLEQWQTLACAITGRNLTVTEWQEAFPGHEIEGYPLICTDFPRHVSIANWLVAEAEQSLVACSDTATAEAQTRYQEALPQASFDTWAVPILLKAALEGASDALANACADQASNLVLEVNAALFSQVRSDVQNLTTSYERFDLDMYNNQRLDLASYEPAAALLDQYVAEQVYQTPCFTLQLPKAAEACASYNQLLQQSGLLNNFIPLTPTNRAANTHTWHFTATAPDFMTIKLDAPGNENYLSLTLFNASDEQIGFSDGSEATALNVLLPEDGVYTIEVYRDGEGAPGSYTLSVETVPSTLITVGTTNEPAEADQRLWQFNASPGDLVTINLVAEEVGSTPYLYLYDENGRNIGRYNDSPGISTVESLLPEDGTYTIEVRWDSEPSRYTLSVETVTPTVIAVGDRDVVAEADQGLWQFDGDQGDFVTINLAASELDSYPILTLFGPNGEQMGYGEGYETAAINALLAENGTYTIKVRWSSESSSYTLSVETVTPTGIAVGDRNVVAEDDQGLWQFNVDQDEFVTINLEASELDSYPILTLFGPNGQQIGYDEGYETVAINALLTEDGAYTIEVRWSSEPSSYNLSIETVTPLLITSNSFSQEAGTEQRWWQFIGEEGTQVVITMDALEGDPYLRLYDPSGSEVASNDDSDGTLNSRIEFVLPANGLYQIEASWFANPGRYRLTFTRQ